MLPLCCWRSDVGASEHNKASFSVTRLFTQIVKRATNEPLLSHKHNAQKLKLPWKYLSPRE